MTVNFKKKSNQYRTHKNIGYINSANVMPSLSARILSYYSYFYAQQK
jgi:hypothetical protein